MVKRVCFLSMWNGIYMRRYRNVLPFPFLQGIEAAARLGNFSLAAHELGLSPAAVSHQMRLLDDRLGQVLFRRVGRQLTLIEGPRVVLHTDYDQANVPMPDGIKGTKTPIALVKKGAGGRDSPPPGGNAGARPNPLHVHRAGDGRLSCRGASGKRE